MGGAFGDPLGGAVRRHGDQTDEINFLVDKLADTNNDTCGSVEQFCLTKLTPAFAKMLRYVANEARRYGGDQ